MKKYFIIFPFLFSLTAFAASSNRCADVFSANLALKTEWKEFKGFRPYNNELNPENLKAAGFRVVNDILYEIKDGRQGPPIGKVMVAESSHLFEWADKEAHDSWHPDGITAEYMKDVLKTIGQVAGKGFYVSMDPIDSALYGDTLTTFKTSGPIVVLEVRESFLSTVYKNTPFVKRLANAGIEGLRKDKYKETWLAMISNRHLQEVIDLPADVVEKVMTKHISDKKPEWVDMRGFYPLIKQLKTEDWRSVPKTNILRRFFMREPIKGEEFAAFLENLNGGVHSDFLKGLLEDFSYSKNPEEALYYLNLLKEIPLVNEVLYYTENGVRSLYTRTLNNNYRAIVMLFDLKSIATTNSLDGMKIVGNLFLKEGLAITPWSKTKLAAATQTAKTGPIRYDGGNITVLPHIFYDLETVPGYRKTPQIEMLSAVLNEWTASAKNDAEFVSRSQWSLEFFFRLYPRYRVPITQGEAG